MQSKRYHTIDTGRAKKPLVAAQQTGPSGQPELVMHFRLLQAGPVRIRYVDTGSGFPLLLIPGGGWNSRIDGFTQPLHLMANPIPPFAAFGAEYRCIASDLRHAEGGETTGPFEADRPWDAYTDDHLALMDHLGIEKFMVMGFCIGGPLIWNLLRRVPHRVVAAVTVQPVGSRLDDRDYFYNKGMSIWGPELIKRRPEISMAMMDRFMTRMYRSDPDFVFTVTRDFVRNCHTPVLILPDDSQAHPYAVAMETAMLAPQSEVSVYPWKEPVERLPLVVRQIRSFLRAHRPDSASTADSSKRGNER